MHHPGPPRFVAVGDAVELAPRDPDPGATYRWRVERAPAASAATVGGAPVEEFVPDAPGRYTVALDAPDGTSRLTVRAFPADRRAAPSDDVGRSATAAVSGSARAPEPATGEGRPRLTLRPCVEDGDLVVRADVAPHPEASESAADLDVEFLVDDRDDLGGAELGIGDRELRIPRGALGDRVRIHAVALGGGGFSVPDCAAFERTAAGVEARRPYDAPSWATDAVIYEIYVRAFGEEEEPPFAAIEERLDYVADLGVDVLWLTPVLQNDHAPHGYNITDFFAVADDLGTREEYERLVGAAHDRDMKVLFDLVCNHSARTHPFFEDAVSNPDSEYRDWYEWRSDDQPETYFDWEHIANFDFTTLAVRRHLLDAVQTWAPLVDGFRCDMAWAVPDGFWREVHDAVKEMDSEFLLLDETIPYIPEFQAGLFDVHFDSTTAFRLREVGAGRADADAVVDAVEQRTATGFPDHAAFMLYAENHDETRYVVECGEAAARAAAGALATLPGTPMLYAGQELGQRGRRDALAWAHADESLREHYRRLLALRREHPALRHDAAVERVSCEVRAGDPAAVTAYARGSGADRVVTVLNFADGEAAVALDEAVTPTDLATGDAVGGEAGLRVADVVVVASR